MNHPKPEEWVPYIFGETTSENRRRLNEHLQSCNTCRNEIQTWQRSRGRLDAWKLPRMANAPARSAPALAFRWAAATALVAVLAAGFALGRFTSPADNIEKVRAALEPGLRQQMRQELAELVRHELAQATPAFLAAANKESKELLANFARAQEGKHTEEAQAIYAALEKLENQRITDFMALKKDLDTVAVNTDAVLRHTEQQLVQLADVSQVEGKK